MAHRCLQDNGDNLFSPSFFSGYILSVVFAVDGFTGLTREVPSTRLISGEAPWMATVGLSSCPPICLAPPV